VLNRRIRRRLRTAPPFAKGGWGFSASFLTPSSAEEGARRNGRVIPFRTLYKFINITAGNNHNADNFYIMLSGHIKIIIKILLITFIEFFDFGLHFVFVFIKRGNKIGFSAADHA